jgi:hypothetical protein
MCDLYLNTEMGLDTPPSFFVLIHTHQMQGNKDMETPLPSCSRHIEQTDEDDILMICDQQTNFRKILSMEQ